MVGGGIDSTVGLEKIYYEVRKNLMADEKILLDGEKNFLNAEEKNLSEFLFTMFMMAQAFDVKKPKTDMAIQYHCDMIILSDMLREGRADQAKKIIDKACEKMHCLEVLTGVFD